ncbi:ADP-ribosylglycohydrolase family protein [Bifidobacterium cuniculi]|uniref:ADP-ribosylglycohydrolase n=1 Tax=Bifidobacterium cuniculi TaxID=1688 RepID=A0A087B4M4_9BIFI|nr:ADP-ribosylglycohydrolase family protein [Bifidobacterium cuniculi]KFI65974.1 ADP-ribosylglycohydrolase [Bifidobacterium cuniculi]
MAEDPTPTLDDFDTWLDRQEQHRHDLAARLLDIIMDTLTTAAVGNAVATPYQGRRRDSYTCPGMPADTTLPYGPSVAAMLTTIATLIDDPNPTADELKDALDDCMQYGTTTADGEPCADGLSNLTQSDCLIRVAPFFLFNADDQQITQACAITDPDGACADAAIRLVDILRALAQGDDPDDIMDNYGYGDLASQPRSQVHADGTAEHTLEAALWCLATTHSAADCICAAANLGGHVTQAATIAGMCAGLRYLGQPAGELPDQWIEQLDGLDALMDAVAGDEDDLPSSDELVDEAQRYLTGNGVDKDLDEAIDCYEEARTSLRAEHDTPTAADLLRDADICLRIARIWETKAKETHSAFFKRTYTNEAEALHCYVQALDAALTAADLATDGTTRRQAKLLTDQARVGAQRIEHIIDTD